MRYPKIILAALVAVALAGAAYAQAAPVKQSLVLEFVDGTELTVVFPDATQYTYANGGIQEEDAIPIGSTIRTGASTTAELRIRPNGTVLKLAKSTTFRIDAIATPQSNQNGFTLVAGKVRAVAAKGSSYDIATSTTVCGVRGTDFSMAFEEGKKAMVLVARGAVEFAKRTADGGRGESIMVGAGQFADLFQGFAAMAFSPDQLAQEFGDVDIKPERMPEQPAEPTAAATETKPAEPAAAATGDAAGTTGTAATGTTPADTTTSTTGTTPSTGTAAPASSATTPATTTPASPTTTKPAVAGGPSTSTSSEMSVAGTDTGAAGSEGPEAAPETERAMSEVESKIMAWLKDVLGMEIGSITINGETWAKAVLQPTFTFGKLRAGLFVPIIYRTNMFDPDDWYHPGGNDEWSFGTDIGFSGDTLFPAILDAVEDFALKFKFIEYGKPLVDKFFVKAGNLDSFTVGHGLVMRNYANDAEFPAIRRLGLNLGLDLGGFGFEALANDLADPEILGGRLYIRPVPNFKLAIGLSGVVDLAPASIFNTTDAPTASAAYGDMMFIGGGLDLDLPIISSDILGIRLFADAAAMVPYVKTPFSYLGHDAAAGFRYDMVYSAEKTLQNYGGAAGIMANVLFLDFRFEFRYYTGVFKPAFFDSGYERKRAELVKEWAGYLSGATAIDLSPTVMGVYGEGGASLMDDKLTLSFGYFWPWSGDITTLTQEMVMTDDYFRAVLEVKKGVIPVVDIAGSIAYERKNFIPTILQNPGASVSLFDENTVFSGELVIPVPNAPNLDLAVVVSTVVERDEAGDVVYLGSGFPSIVPIFTLETRLHF